MDSNDYTYTAATTRDDAQPPEHFCRPSVTFDWTTAVNATGYYLWIGSTVRARITFITRGEDVQLHLQQPSHECETIYVRLTTTSMHMAHTDYTYTGRRGCDDVAHCGSAFPEQASRFDWTTIASATGYYLWIGSTGWLEDIYNSAEKTVITYTFPRMPRMARPFTFA